MKLIAIKPFSYNTRRLQAGDTFDTKNDRDAKLLLAIKKVRSLEDRPEEKVPAPPKDLIKKIKDTNESKIPVSFVGEENNEPESLELDVKETEEIKELDTPAVEAVEPDGEAPEEILEEVVIEEDNSETAPKRRGRNRK